MGLPYYFTGAPCKNGHTDRRRVDNSSCLACDRARALVKYHKTPQVALERQKRWRKRNPNRIRENQWRALGMEFTVAQYDEMLAKQGGVCAICSEVCSTNAYLCVDHNHDTGKIRGLLCRKCNAGLGNLGDTTQQLAKALAYLESNDVTSEQQNTELSRRSESAGSAPQRA